MCQCMLAVLAVSMCASKKGWRQVLEQQTTKKHTAGNAHGHRAIKHDLSADNKIIKETPSWKNN